MYCGNPNCFSCTMDATVPCICGHRTMVANRHVTEFVTPFSKPTLSYIYYTPNGYRDTVSELIAERPRYSFNSLPPVTSEEKANPKGFRQKNKLKNILALNSRDRKKTRWM